MNSKYSFLFILFFLFVCISMTQVNTPKARPVKQPKEEIELILIDSTTTATVYNATVKQCNRNPSKPANPHFTIDLKNPGAHRIIAMERTMRKKYELKYGDILYIEGTDYDGYWQLQDCMNKRYKGQSRIDLLVDDSIHLGKWKNVRVYKVKCSDILKEEISSKHFISSL